MKRVAIFYNTYKIVPSGTPLGRCEYSDEEIVVNLPEAVAEKLINEEGYDLWFHRKRIPPTIIMMLDALAQAQGCRAAEVFRAEIVPDFPYHFFKD